MAFGHGKSASVLVGEYDLTAYLNSAEISGEVSTHNSTTFGNNSETHQPGITSGGLQLGGFFDRTVGSGSHAVLASALGAAAAKVATVAPEGCTLSYPCALVGANETKYDDAVKIDSLTSVAANLRATGGAGGIDVRGICRHTLAAVGATANAASVDHGAASANGGAAHLHYTASTNGGGSATVKIQHSADGSTWADLATFTTLLSTPYAAQRIEVAAGTTVNRYLRVAYTVAGTGVTFTFTVAFSRR